VPVIEIIPTAGARANNASLAGSSQMINSDVDLVEVRLRASQADPAELSTFML
jgi:hypothetical protein